MTKKNKNQPQKRLGRGLSSLLGDTAQLDPTQDTADSAPGHISQQKFKMIAVELISPGPWQPRKIFDEAGIDELAQSIAQKGIIQPVILRPDETQPNRYQIIAGERRWRAAQRATIHEVPAIIQHFSDQDAAELALVENIQRRDLSVVEEAESYYALMSSHGYTQEECAEIVGKSRSHIANLLRLLNLPEAVREMLLHEKLSMGQARPLIGHPEAEKIAQQVIKEQLSARQVEALIRRSQQSVPTQKQEKSTDIRAIELQAQTNLGLNLSLDWNEGSQKGKISIRVTSLDQLDDLLHKIGVSTA